MLKPWYIAPSLLVEGLYCNRRLWLKAHNIEIFEDNQYLTACRTLKQHISGLTIDDSDWLYEARLPSGTRIDAWLPEECLGVEFKSGTPHPTHLYQVWAIRQELSRLGVNECEMQLWYKMKFSADATALAKSFDLEYGQIDDDIFAICTESEDPDFLIRLERGASILIDQVELDTPPKAKEPADKTCMQCAYSEWCYC
ncbi:MAG: hypothetical protein ACNA8K_16305 [Cyclonatronaceae bacterium]